jgi:ribosomal protein S18 acetylase RimI-like enzyme
VSAPEWRLRPASPADRDFIFGVQRTTLREYAEPLWGWDDARQSRRFAERFAPDRWEVVQVGDEDVGVLEVEERADELVLANIELLPHWQGRGLGGAIVDALLARAASEGRALTLRVLATNERAVRLYERRVCA